MDTEHTADHLTLREAAARFGVSVRTLHRRLADGGLPEAVKVDMAHGPAWVIPMTEVEVIAQREGWVIDLTDATTNDSGNGGVSPDMLRKLLETRTSDAEEKTAALVDAAKSAGAAQVAEMKAKLDVAEAAVATAKEKTETEIRRVQQLAADLDHERAEVSRQVAEVSRLTAALAAAEARAQSTQQLVVRADADAVRERERADVAEARAAEAERVAVMGWRERRRWRRGTR